MNIDSGLVEIVDDYCLTYSLMWFFDKNDYKEQLDKQLRSVHVQDWDHPQAILVYADEVGFEGLLAVVNADERFKDCELLK